MRKILFFLLCVLAFSAQAAETPVALQTPTGEIHGTVLMPDGRETADVVLIVAGSGPVNRNGNSPRVENNSLRFLAESLAEEGIASVRFDKRGIAVSRTAGRKESELRFDHYIDDVRAWIDLLAGDPRFGKIYIAGHSEGSLIGMSAAADNPQVAGFISIAGAGRKLGDILREQTKDTPQPYLDMIYAAIDSLEAGRTVAVDAPALLSLFRTSVQPYLISSMRYDPAEIIAGLTIPVLIVQGGTDIQIALLDAELLAAAKPDAKLVVITDMNHVMKKIDTTDKPLQMQTYMDPALKNHPELIGAVSRFIHTTSSAK